MEPRPELPSHARIRAHPERDRTADAPRVLASGLVAHVGFVGAGRPVVIPMTYEYSPEEPRRLYLHGGVRGRLMRHLGTGAPVGVTVTLVDGLVYSRTALDHSVNYRSVVLFARAAARQPDLAERRRVLEAMIARYFPGRRAGVDYESPPDAHLDATAMVALEIDEWSAKVREGGPNGPTDGDATRPGTAGVLCLGGEQPFHGAGRRGVLSSAMRPSERFRLGLVRLPVLAALLGTMLAGRAAAQAPASTAGPGFIVARYATRSSLAFYGGYAFGPGFAVLALVQNPRTGYREAIVGGGAPLMQRGGLGATMVLAAANTSDGWYAQLYVLPAVRAGRLSVDGTIEGCQPLGRGGTRELDVAPIVAVWALGRTVGVGGAYHLASPAGARAAHAAGPALRLAIPGGAVTLELLRGLVRAPSELRLTLRTARN